MTYYREHKECGMRMSDNRLLERIFVPESENVKGGWGKLLNKERHGLYLAGNVIGSCYGEWAVGRLIGSCYGEWAVGRLIGSCYGEWG